MSNARNLANLLNTDTTLATGDVADGSITTAKIADSAVTNAKFQNAPTFTGKLTADNIESGDIRIEDPSPTLLYNDTNESTDNKAFQLTGNGGVFQIQYLNDSLGGGGGYISFPRTGNNLDSFDMFRAGALKNRLTTTGDNYITSGNFGVGTTNPQQKMHVSYDTSNTNLGNNAGADITTGMRIHNENTTNGSYASIDLRASSGDVRLTSVYKGTGNTSDFVVLNDGGSSTLQEVMSINSSGHSTLPKQPSCLVRKNGNLNAPQNSAFSVTGWTSLHDVGSMFNSSNSRITVPTAGSYIVGSALQANGVTGLHIAILKNDAAIGTDSFLNVVDAGAVAMSICVTANANDYFTVSAYVTHSGMNIQANRSKFWVVKVA